MQNININNFSATPYKKKKSNISAQKKSNENPDKKQKEFHNNFPKTYCAGLNVMFSGALYSSSIMRKEIKKGSFMSNNQVTNERLSSEFDNAVKTQNVSDLIKFTDSKLPPLKSTDTSDKSEQIIDTHIGTDARIEIMGENKERLFITEDELRAAGRDEPTVLTAKGGARFSDPHNQTNWPKVLNRIWPPADSTGGTNVLKKLTPVNGGNIIETNDSVGKEYGVHPNGIVLTDKSKGRIYIFSQLENYHQTINWGTWVVAPFKVSKENGAVVVVPHYENDDTARIQNHPKWEKQGKYILLDTLPDGGMSDIIGNADHAVLAKSGSKDAFMIRRLSGSNGKIKIHCPSGKNCEYVELEHMGPEISSPEKSTIAYVIDIVPKDLIPEEFSKDRKTLKEQTIKLAEKIG